MKFVGAFGYNSSNIYHLSRIENISLLEQNVLAVYHKLSCLVELHFDMVLELELVLE